jgi:hypothetical protein
LKPCLGVVRVSRLPGFQAVGKLVPTLGHQKECGFDLFDCGELHYAKAIGGIRPVLVWCRHTIPLTMSSDIVREPQISSMQR